MLPSPRVEVENPVLPSVRRLPWLIDVENLNAGFSFSHGVWAKLINERKASKHAEELVPLDCHYQQLFGSSSLSAAGLRR